MQVSRNATTAMTVCIALYMPPSVKVAYGANYNQPVVNGTGSADLSNTTGGIPQAGCVIIYSYVG